MHASERTLLNRLGFSDKDKINGVHDLACKYVLTQACVVAQAICPIRNKLFKPWESKHEELERVLSNGDGPYKQHIGFLDAVFVVGTELAEVVQPSFEPLCGHRSGAQHLPENSYDCRVGKCRCVTIEAHKTSKCGMDPKQRAACFVVEVKISPVSVGDLLRQMKLYKEYWNTNYINSTDIDELYFVVALAYEPSTVDVQALRSEGIFVLSLGDKFKKWCANIEKTDKADLVEV